MSLTMKKVATHSRNVVGLLCLATLLVATSLISGRPVQGGEFWQKKDYHQWSESDCRKLLEDSPWALKYAMNDNGSNTAAGSISPYSPNATLQGIEYQAQFRSALPIRQAIVRLAQIKRKYDKMTPEQKKIFDEQTDQLLNANFQDRMVLYFTYGSNATPVDKELAIYWKKQTTDTLKNSVFLVNQRGEKIPLLNYGANNGDIHEFEFDFPRVQAGKPVILPDDKNVRLEFVHPSVGQRPVVPIVLNFKPAKMVTAGSLIY